MCNDAAARTRMALYESLPSVQPQAWFGYSQKDWGDLMPDDWFHANQERFLFDLEEIPRFPFAWGAGPHSEGIYFLFLGDALVYVGQSKYIKDRLHRHAFPTPCRIPAGWFSHWGAIWVPRMFLDSVESFYIHYFDPPRNAKLPPLYEPASMYLEKIEA